MRDIFTEMLKEAGSKTPVDFPGIYDPDSILDPKPLEVAAKLCRHSGIEPNSIPIKDLVDFGKAHIKAVFARQNADKSLRIVDGYDISSADYGELEDIYKEWNRILKFKATTQEEVEKSNADYMAIAKKAAKIGFPSYPVKGTTVWEGLLTITDIVLAFENYELSSLGKSSES